MGISQQNYQKSISLSGFGSQSNSISGQATVLNPPTISSGFKGLLIGGSESHSHLKKTQIYESVEDLLALSVAAHRVSKESYYQLTDHNLYLIVSPDDRALANEIRKYYSQKFVMVTLKEGKMAGYREQISKLVNSDGKVFKDEQIGPAYYLPKFYFYDLGLDEVKQSVNPNQNFNEFNRNKTPSSLKLIENLVPLNKKLHRKTKHKNNFEYWFKDKKLNAGVMISLQHDNPLLKLFEHFYFNSNELNIQGNFHRKTLDQFEYFDVTNFEIVHS